jgi:hypothetical protein
MVNQEDIALVATYLMMTLTLPPHPELFTPDHWLAGITSCPSPLWLVQGLLQSSTMSQSEPFSGSFYPVRAAFVSSMGHRAERILPWVMSGKTLPGAGEGRKGSPAWGEENKRWPGCLLSWSFPTVLVHLLIKALGLGYLGLGFLHCRGRLHCPLQGVSPLKLLNSWAKEGFISSDCSQAEWVCLRLTDNGQYHPPQFCAGGCCLSPVCLLLLGRKGPMHQG